MNKTPSYKKILHKLLRLSIAVTVTLATSEKYVFSPKTAAVYLRSTMTVLQNVLSPKQVLVYLRSTMTVLQNVLSPKQVLVYLRSTMSQ